MGKPLKQRVSVASAQGVTPTAADTSTHLPAPTAATVTGTDNSALSTLSRRLPYCLEQ